MLASKKFSMRMKPEIENRLEMLATKMGRTKSSMVNWLIQTATEDMPPQKVLIVKGKKRRAK